MKTVVTISTPMGNGAIGIIRMTGDDSLKIASQLFTTKKLNSFLDAEPNYMYYGTIKTSTISDTILAVYFKNPHSYTGEDLVEFQCHGGVRILEEILKACVEKGAQIADKGEFTRRAFINGKMTLSDAEGVIDMINAESIAAINAGYRLSKGGISDSLIDIQNKILDCISELEASLDYPDEMEDESKSFCRDSIVDIKRDLNNLLNTSQIGGYIKKGIEVAIIGIANVGKSSLLNTLLGRNRAIVTDIAGTTRDSIEETIEVNGVLLKLVDTAGIRETSDVVESIGVQKSIDIAKKSDIVLFISEAGRNFTEEELSLINELERNNQKIIYAYNKVDLNKLLDSQKNGIGISVKEKVGIEELKEKIVKMFVDKKIDSSSVVITNQRHADLISQAIKSLENVEITIDIEPIECIVIDLRNAYFNLGSITGNCANDDIIDNIFNKFCLGK